MRDNIGMNDPLIEERVRRLSILTGVEEFYKTMEEYKLYSQKRVESGDVFITHYINDEIPRKITVLKKLFFLSTDSIGIKEGYYFQGYGCMTRIYEEVLRIEIKEGSIVKFPKPIGVTKYEKSLFIDHKGIIHIADHERPWEDLEKRAVYDSKRNISLI